MFILDSRRSYRAYSYAGLILIKDLFSVRTPVGVTELILITDLCLFRTPVGVTELILIQKYLKLLQNLYWCYVSYTCTTKYILVLWNLYWSFGYESILRYYWTYTYFTDTGVPVGTTGLILILLLREYP